MKLYFYGHRLLLNSVILIILITEQSYFKAILITISIIHLSDIFILRFYFLKFVQHEILYFRIYYYYYYFILISNHDYPSITLEN